MQSGCKTLQVLINDKNITCASIDDNEAGTIRGSVEFINVRYYCIRRNKLPSYKSFQCDPIKEAINL